MSVHILNKEIKDQFNDNSKELLDRLDSGIAKVAEEIIEDVDGEFGVKNSVILKWLEIPEGIKDTALLELHLKTSPEETPELGVIQQLNITVDTKDSNVQLRKKIDGDIKPTDISLTIYSMLMEEIYVVIGKALEE